MLSIQEATRIVRDEIPFGKIQAVISYKGKYVFQIFGDDPLEGQMDPFYSVDKKTGEFSDFSILTDGNFSEISPLFLEAKKEI